MQIITISRQTASRGEELAQELSKRMGLKLIDRQYALENWLPEIADEHQLHMLEQSSKFYTKIANPEAKTEEQFSFAQFIATSLKSEAEKNNIIIIGLGAQIIFQNHPRAIHIKIVASEEFRVAKLASDFGLKKEQALRSLELSDRKHRRYIWKVHKQDWSETTIYHLIINSNGLNFEEALALLMNLIDLKKANPGALKEKKENEKEKGIEIEIESNEDRSFGHESEKEFAKILNMHHIKWEYEPTEFPLEWDAEGNITMAFRPDFYLTEYDTYLELTTMKRKYTTEKNKKVRLVQKIYPDINIKIIYKKDFQQLAEKFDLEKGEQ